MDDDKHDLDEHELSELTKEVAKRLERRGVLQAGAGLAAGGAAGYLASGRASAGSNQTGTIGSGGSPVDVVAEDIYGPGGQGSNDAVAFEAVATAKAKITDETLISAYASTTKSIPSTSFETVEYDTVVKDELGEYDVATHQFTPASTGWYWVVASVGLDNNTDGDRFRLVLRTSGGSTQKELANRETAGGEQDIVNGTVLVNLKTGTNYEIQVANLDSSDTLAGNDIRSYLMIRSAYR